MEDRVRRLLVLGVVLGAFAVGVAGCGDSDSGSTATETTEEHASSAAEALEQVRAIPALLDDAVATYTSGDQEAAADAVGDIYLEHYEDVEGPLGDRNHDLMEELEEQISTELRQDMEAGKPQGEIEALVADIKSNLERAEQELG
jgi:hypothetical protein